MRWISYRGRLLTPAEFAEAKYRDSKRSGILSPNIISDCMDTVLNHADGRHYSSKSQFRQATKSAGCEEVGNDSSYLNPQPRKYEPDRNDIRNDIKRAMDKG